MKLQILILILVSFTQLSFAGAVENRSIQADYCFGSGGIYLFKNCINRNFDKVKKTHRVNIFSCPNINNEYDSFFENCVNLNFNKIGRKLKKRMQYCTTTGNPKATAVVGLCINNNFSKM